MLRLLLALILAVPVYPATIIGLTNSPSVMAQHTIPMHSISTGFYRTLGDAANWADWNPDEAGVYNWRPLDSVIETAIANHNSTIMVEMYLTPTWASAGPGDGNCLRLPGSCDPPRDLLLDGSGSNAIYKRAMGDMFDHLYTTYPGIHFIGECWNEPLNGAQMWNGTMTQLVRLCADAAPIAHSYGYKVSTSPNPGLTVPFGQTFQHEYLQALVAHGDMDQYDYIGFHGYVQASNNDPQLERTSVIEFMRNELKTFNLHQPMIDSEWSWASVSLLPGPGDQVAFVAQSVLVQMQPDIAFINWYAYDYDFGSLCPGTPCRGGLTRAGVAFKQVADWVGAGTVVTSPCEVIPGTSTWACELSRKGQRSMVLWDDTPHNYSLPAGLIATKRYDLFGRTTLIQTDKIPLNRQPIMIDVR